MRLLLAGTPPVAVVALNALVTSAHEVVAVLTRPDAPRGRSRMPVPSPMATRADQLGLPRLQPRDLREPEVAEQLRCWRVDCCPVVAYGALVPPDLLSVPTHGWVNLHFSLLPAWRGAAPVQHAILHGDDITGASTFQLTEGLDTGPVFGTVTEPVRDDDTSGAVLERLAVAGARLLVHTLDAIAAGTAVAREQAESGASSAPKLTPDDARIRWSDPALAIDRRIRACTPEPGAWTQIDGGRLGIRSLRHPLAGLGPEPPTGSLRPGEVRVTKHEVWVGTGSRDVQLDVVQPPGRRAMSAADWARGIRSTDGLTLR